MLNLIAVSCTTPELSQQAQHLAAQLHLPFIADRHSEKTIKYQHLLLLTPDYLGLSRPSAPKTTPFYIDFLSGKLGYRSKQAGLRSELIARAIGLSPRENPIIIDATAGLGRDSFILASLGFEVSLLERSPIIHALLANALKRAQADQNTAPIIARMRLIHADALAWLPGKQCDVITVDPMFPERKKSSSVKKEMVIMQDILGKDEDSAQLLTLALTCAARRVVVKRPRLAVNIANLAPTFSLTGKSSRFDIYLSRKKAE